jgi:hypothetical protein
MPQRVGSADVVEVESRGAPDLQGVFAQLQQTIANMLPEDLNLEIEADRVRTRVRFRAYRHR